MSTDVTEPGGQIAQGAGEAAKSAGGMPQLDFTTFPNQIFWLAITLVVIFLILNRVVLPRIEAILAERQGTITNDLSAAEELRNKAVEAEAAYERALADARSEAGRIVAQTRAEIQAELDAAIARADAEIAARSAESEKAIAEVRASAQEAIREVANETARAVLASFGAKADAKTIRAAVEARMKG